MFFAFIELDLSLKCVREMLTLTTAFAQFVRAQAMPPFLVLRDLAAQFAKIVPETRDRLSFRRFWGEEFLTTDVFFVADSYENVRLRDSFRRAEALASQERSEGSMGNEIIQGSLCPQAAAMLTALFLRYSGKALKIISDAEPISEKDAILICYGTPDTNFKTFEAEASSGSNLCQFLGHSRGGHRGFRVASQVHCMENRAGELFDKAVVQRIRQSPTHAQVICAGLSEWGSLAAVHYLVKNWKNLQKRFDKFQPLRDFCVLLEVPYGQFEKTRELISVVSWESRPAHQHVLESSNV